MAQHALDDDETVGDAYAPHYEPGYGYDAAHDAPADDDAATGEIARPAAPTLFGREPAMLLSIVSAVVALASSTLLHLSVDQQGVVNAVAAGVLGLVVAIRVKGGTWVAALMALAQAIMAGTLAWKFHLHPDVQSGVLALIAVVGGYATRQVVTAPEPPAVPGSSKVA